MTTDLPPTLESLGLDRLPAADRLALAHQLLDSLAADVEPGPLTPEQAAELDRRLLDMEENPDDEVPWEEVKAASLARCRK
jgi:putative addiction module component (TIGR02574 family)